MAKVSTWRIIIIAMVLCFVFYYLTNSPLQKKLGQLHCFTSRGSHYWNKFNLPPIPEQFYLFWPSSQHIERNDDIGLPIVEANIADEREKNKVLEAAEESIEKTKMMMEDSAKTAAEMVGEAVHKTADIMKEAFSHHHHQDEL
ncbi:uncharacterized protein LOC110726743 [Chenopodium quinoa]|nr:uncharacterized protein LOC110726743 [Chenopodium quinoa]